MLSKDEKEMVKGASAVGPKKELNIEGEFMTNPKRKFHFLKQAERFKETLFCNGTDDMRLGHASRDAIELTNVTTQRSITEHEDLHALTIFGTTREVMERDLEIAPKRAAAAGQELYVYDAFKEFPHLKELQRYSETQLNAVRKHGFERTGLWIGKRVLIQSKVCCCSLLSLAFSVASYSDALVVQMVRRASGESGSDNEDVCGDAHSMQFDDDKYVTGNMPGTIIKIKKAAYITVRVDHRPHGSDVVMVPVMEFTSEARIEGQYVTVPLIPVKPWHDRVVDLCQGTEHDGLVHVQAAKIFGRGKFYVAMTRAKTVRNLKLSGVEPTFAGVRKVLRSHWRALCWLSRMGEYVPAPCLTWATQLKERYNRIYE